MARTLYDGPGSSVILTAVGSDRVRVLAAIRAVRADLGLQQAQALIRSLPQTILDDVGSDVAGTLARTLKAAGASVEVKREVIGVDVNAWLKTRVTVQEAEDAHRVESMQPFGYTREAWLKLIASMQPKDELWTFCSPEINWRFSCGREGVALVRAGRVIDTIITRMN
jgi:hypothetical protein